MGRGRGFAASVDQVQEGMEASAYSSEGWHYAGFHGRVGVDQGGLVAALEIRVVGVVLGGSAAWVAQSGDPWEQVIQGEE